MKTINTIVKFCVILLIAAITFGFLCPRGAHAQDTVQDTVQLLEEANAVIASVRAELAESKARLAELEAKEAQIMAEVQVKAEGEGDKTKAKAKTKSKAKVHHTIQLTQGENILQVKKSASGFFAASVANRTFATVNQGYVTLKAGKNIRSKLFAKAKCEPKSKTCEIRVFVNGPGSLVYGNLYRVFGYENLAVRRVFKIGQDLKVSVPKTITLKVSQPEA